MKTVYLNTIRAYLARAGQKTGKGTYGDLVKAMFEGGPKLAIGVKGGSISLESLTTNCPNIVIVKRWPDVVNVNYLEPDNGPQFHTLQPAIINWKD